MRIGIFNKAIIALSFFVLFTVISIACSSEAETVVETVIVEKEVVKEVEKADRLTGTIEIDGSSTVYPITFAVAEEFRKIYPDVQIPVGISGTGGGMKRFAVGETSMSNASRPIKDKEAAAASENGIEFIELAIAYDGLSVVVNTANDWLDCLTTEELNKIWAPDSKLSNWSEVRDGFPNQAMRLYGPGTDSGTFDYFTDEINGEEGASRADYSPSEDDNVLVQGVAGDKGSLGYFGYAYYLPNADKLKLVAIDGGTGCISPDSTTINDGSYAPLSRPLFIYVNKADLSRPDFRVFVDYYLTNAAQYAEEVGYVALPDDMYADEKAKIK
jgi:phosphate transport system substrate-binding protein